MVSFWPFKGDENSAASFEKKLSQLSDKIEKLSAENDRYRLRRRKYKVLWSLYAVFGYMIIAAILILVIGFQNWTAIEYTIVAGGPPFIYGIRTALNSYYGYRLSNSQSQLADVTKQREATIERLKAATKYNSTQQLLDKYGGAPASPQQQQKQKPSAQQLRKRKSDIGQATQSAQQFGRTGFAPPPTANIQGRQPQAGFATRPHSSAGFATRSAGTPPPSEQPGVGARPGEEFAPNAFSPPSRPPRINRPPSQYAIDGPKWYDRILDVMLGEDEMQAKNRIVLICDSCRLVNGQAPPGARTPEEIGKWRCGGCHVWNGVESEEKKILKQMSQADPLVRSSEPAATSFSERNAIPQSIDESHEYIKEEVEEKPVSGEEENEHADVAEEAMEGSAGDDAEDAPPASSTRSKIRRRTHA